jgi:hypothetical protein
MSGFSPAEAALEGFRLTRENPRAFGAWVGASYFVSVVVAICTVFLPADVRHGLETISAKETPTAAQLLDALILVAPILILGLTIQCVMAAAVYRLIFRHEDTRFGYLRLGADELRLIGLTIIYFGLAMALMLGLTIGAAIITSLAAMAGTGAAALVGMAVSLFSAGILVFVLVRLSLAPVATFAERRLAIFESWTLTRGQFWRLLGAYGMALACIAAIGFLLIVVFTAVAGVAVMSTGGQLADVAAAFTADETSLRSYLRVGVIAYMLVSSIFSALYNAVIAAPAAIAYQHLHGPVSPHHIAAQANPG